MHCPPLPDAPDGARNVLSLFSRSCADARESPAVRDGSRVYSYARLDADSDRIAARLRESSAPGALVGVCMARGYPMIAALLGTLKAGAAYVPLDPAYPVDRLRYIIANAAACVVICDGSTRALVESLNATSLEVDDAFFSAGSARAPRVPHTDLVAGQAAYAIYTSGSTGQPKGVLVPHRALSALLAWAHDAYCRDELAVTLAATSISFDISVFEIFVPLTCGASILIAENALQLSELESADMVTLLNTVPSAASALLSMGPLPRSIRTINLAGEPLRRSLVDLLYREPSVRRVVNLYGPTEDTVYSTFAVLERDAPSPPPIGHPLPGTTAYVVDERMREVAEGEPGELLLGGNGQSLGYLGRSALTAERYVPSPFAGGPPGARLYRTGDLVRRRSPDGALEYIGRIDHQVKLRGYRIELGEIEAVLSTHPDVLACVVIVRKDAAGIDFLAGFVQVRGSGHEAVQAALEARLRSTLPEYMRPQVLVMRRQLPLTPNGKIDRRALEHESLVAPTVPRRGPAPEARTPAEGRLLELVTEVLGFAPMSLDRSLIELGATSLAMARLTGRINRAFEVSLPLSRVMRASSLRELAHHAASAPRLTPANLRLPTHSVEQANYPLSSMQQSLWFQAQLAPDDTTYNVALRIDVDAPVDAEAMQQALTQVVRRHLCLSGRFVLLGDRPAQQIDRSAKVSLDVTEASVTQLGALAATLARRPVALDRAPLLIALLVRTSKATSTLLMVVPHAVCDEWSMQILTSELRALYAAQLAVRSPDLPVPAIQYGDFARFQQDWFRSPEYAACRAYWIGKLTGCRPLLELPRDPHVQAASPSEASSFDGIIDAQLWRRVEVGAREADCSVYALLLTAFFWIVHRQTEQSDLVVGCASSGRFAPELEPLIGCFTNLLPLRAVIAEGSSVAQLLPQVQETVVGALEHEGMPFQHMVEALGIKRALQSTPLVQVAFGVRDRPTLPSSDALPRMQLVDLASEQARFDLTVWVEAIDGRARCRWLWRKSLFQRATIERWHGQFCSAVEELLGCTEPNPRAHVGTREQGFHQAAGARVQPAKVGEDIHEWLR